MPLAAGMATVQLMLPKPQEEPQPALASHSWNTGLSSMALPTTSPRQLGLVSAQVWQAAAHDVTREALEAFATAASGGAPFPIPIAQMVHGAAVTEAVVRSARSGRSEPVE